MKISTLTKRPLLWLFLVSVILFSCKDDKDHYEEPAWLRGSLWEALEAEGDCSLFLQGVELAGFRPYLEGEGILTVMAPDDQAVQAYLTQKGYSSLESMSAAELKKLFGFHLLYYSYRKAKLENFRPEGDLISEYTQEALDAGMYYKFRTRSNDAPTYIGQNDQGSEITVYHLERFLPVYSHNFFTSKRIDAKSNYEYFYPGSTWTGENGFNVSEASVTHYELRGHNGYIYKIDRVLEPLETIYNQLKNDGNFSQFLTMYDYASYYVYDQTLSEDFGEVAGVDSLWLHMHADPLPPIALEWPVTNYVRLDTLAFKSYSVFAPSNQALNTFYSEYWQGGGYASIYEVDPLISQLLMAEHVYGGSVVFPEEITTQKVTGSAGPFSFDPYALTYKKMCVNGSLYGLDEVSPPATFFGVSGPAFQQERYNYFLYAMYGSGKLNQFGSNQPYTLIIPDNRDFMLNGYVLGETTGGYAIQTVDGEVASNVSSATLETIVNLHTMVGEHTFATTGRQIIPQITPYSYFFIRDGEITCSDDYNSAILNPYAQIDPFVPFVELTNNGKPWNNGKAYTYQSGKGLFGGELQRPRLQSVLSNNNDLNYPYYVFVQLLKRAGMVNGNDITSVSGRFILFIPKNEVLYQALQDNTIPGITGGYFDANGVLQGNFDTETLQHYLNNYFVASNHLTSDAYPGSEVPTGDYMTYSGNWITYTDSGTSLTIQLQGSPKIVPVSADYDYFPFAYSDGSFHFIESLL